VPDGRFYTKANFFTLRNHSRDGIISEQYQTDAEPGEQEVFDEMMYRRNNMSKTGMIQAPAVPGQQQMKAAMRSPQSHPLSHTPHAGNTVDYEEHSR
jgi:hypothetical protein